MTLPNLPLLANVSAVFPPGVPLYLVGGAVRDLLLGRAVRDLDFVLPDQAIQWGRRVANHLQGAFYPLDEERDTGRVILTLPDGGRIMLDFAHQQGESLEDDLHNRDFTVNAIALDVHQPDRLIDPLGGAADLHARQLRQCSPTACLDDPLRTLRAVRLAVNYGLKILPETRQSILEAAPGLERISHERLRDEIFHVLESHRIASILRLMEALELLPYTFPELLTLAGEPQSPPHTLDVWEHTLSVVQHLEMVINALDLTPPEEEGGNLMVGLLSVRLGRFRESIHAHLQARPNPHRTIRELLFLAAIYHDAGKPATRSLDETGRFRFFDHEKVGRKLIVHRGRELRLSNEEVDRLATIVAYHLRPILFANAAQKPGRRAIYRFFRQTGAAGIDVCLLSLADVLGTYGPTLNQEVWLRHLDVLRELFETWWERQQEVVQPPVLLTGGDLMRAFGLPAGPQLGEILELVREGQAAGEINSREEALEFVRAHIHPAD